MKIKVSDSELSLLLHHMVQLAESGFNEVLGFSIEPPDLDTGCLKFEMRKELMGNPVYRTLHGGVISAILDSVGGNVVYLRIFKEMKGKPLEKQVKRLSKVGTIDLRVDYLRPGTGKSFSATGYLLRFGNKVAVTRMELHNDEQVLIAAGTASYTVG